MTFRRFFAYAIRMGEMKRQIAWENEQSSRYASTVAICASIIAAVRLARDDIGGSSPKLTCAVADRLCRWVLSDAAVVLFTRRRKPGIDGRVELEIACVVDLLDHGKAWELDEVDLAQRQFEKDSSDRTVGFDADLLACCVDHDSGSVGSRRNRSESPKSVNSVTQWE
jgi:hypothetical protein